MLKAPSRTLPEKQLCHEIIRFPLQKDTLELNVRLLYSSPKSS